MYLTHVKTLLIESMRFTFDSAYPEADFQDLQFSVEFPVKAQQYPSVWVNFDPIGPLRPVGIGHFEDVQDGGVITRVSRWSFAGNCSFTPVALSSTERDRMFDQLVSVIAFGEGHPTRGRFRDQVESDPLIGLAVNFDQVEQRGFSASPGTPWGTDDMMYEATLTIQCMGEFITPEDAERELMPISSIEIISWVEDLESDPTTGGGWIS